MMKLSTMILILGAFVVGFVAGDFVNDVKTGRETEAYRQRLLNAAVRAENKRIADVNLVLAQMKNEYQSKLRATAASYTSWAGAMQKDCLVTRESFAESIKEQEAAQRIQRPER
jgi:uncharacterized membrane-anchored protein YhcB (DUF1043 family)